MRKAQGRDGYARESLDVKGSGTLSSAMPSRGVLAGVLVTVVMTVTAAVHWPVLNSQAILFDDYEYVQDNPLVQKPGMESAGRFFSEVLTPSTVGGYYQPLAMVSLMIDYALGARPTDYRVFHATSLLLHAGCTGLVIWLVFSLFGSAWGAAGAGLLFGLHPGAVESVAWVSDRKTLLASFFALWSLICYVRYVRRASGGKASYVGCMVLFVLALLSKPTTTPLPLVMLLMDVWPLRRMNRRAVLEKIPLLVISVMFGIITIISQGRTADVSGPGNYPLWATPLLLCHNIVFYLWKIFWPTQLSAYYAWPQPFTMSQPAVQFGLIGTIVFLAALLVSLRWTRSLVVGWLIFFITIFPAMGVIGFTIAIAADRYAYLPKIGLLLPIGCWLAALHDRQRFTKALRIGSLALILVLAVAETTITRGYLARWRDTEGFFRYMVARQPDSAYLRGNLGNVLYGQKKFDEAGDQYREALKYESNPSAHAGLAVILAAKGQLAEAETHLREAVRLYPKNAAANDNLGVVLDRQGKSEEAGQYFEAALRCKPNSVMTLLNDGLRLFRLRRMDEAAARFAQAIQIEPGFATAHYQWGCLLMSQGRNREGLDHWRMALRLDGGALETMNNLAWVLATADDAALRNGREAVEIAERERLLTGETDPAVLDTLGAAYAEAGRLNEAAATAQKSIDRWKAMGNSERAQQVNARWELYRQGKAYHEPIQREAYLAR